MNWNRESYESLGDEERAALAASHPSLNCAAAIIWNKGDWMEYATTWAFYGWKHSQFPCFTCFANSMSLYHDSRASPYFEAWEAKTLNEYEKACEASEVNVVVEKDTHSKICAALYLLRAKNKIGGRVLRWGIPTMPPLLMGDRLEPSNELPNVGDLEKMNSRAFYAFGGSLKLHG